MSRSKAVFLVVLAAPLVLFGLISAAWAVAAPSDSELVVASNVELAGSDIGGTSGNGLQKRIESVTSDFPKTPIRIVTPKFTIETTADDLGLSVDTEATKVAALSLGRSDPGPLAPLRWAKSLLTTRSAPLKVVIDTKKAEKTISDKEGDRRTKAVAPTFAIVDGKVSVTPGSNGEALDIDDIVSRVPLDISRIGATVTIDAKQVETVPDISNSDAERLAKQANDMTAEPLTVSYGSKTAELAAADLRPSIQLIHGEKGAQLSADKATVAKLIGEKIPTPANPTNVMFDIVNGVPTPKAGKDAEVCCGDDAPDLIVKALLAGQKKVELPTRKVTAADGVKWASKLGVKEVVGEFTTKHPAGQPRVINIHKMSDITRGVLIAPGETFSANGYVGKRTKEKGFVSAPVIEDGKFSEDFGGGVSQWATTTFNAAFFAGLDIPEHKAHSIYISRYPFGREATLAFPSVDLKIKNNTPYGVVIWPTYTNSSITVQLWSTRFATGAQTGANKTSGCGNVRITRTRTFVDGHTDTNNYVATYNCNPPKHP